MSRYPASLQYHKPVWFQVIKSPFLVKYRHLFWLLIFQEIVNLLLPTIFFKKCNPMENIQNKSFKSFHLINNKVLTFFQGFQFESLSWGKVYWFPISQYSYFSISFVESQRNSKIQSFQRIVFLYQLRNGFSPLYSSILRQYLI